MDKYQVLYMDDKSVRHIVELPNITDRIELIGITRYTDFQPEAQVRGQTYPAMNGAYPALTSGMFNEVYGKLLTVCDASFTDSIQREAFKSLIKGTMSDWYDKNVSYTAKMTEQLVKLNK